MGILYLLLGIKMSDWLNAYQQGNLMNTIVLRRWPMQAPDIRLGLPNDSKFLRASPLYVDLPPGTERKKRLYKADFFFSLNRSAENAER